MDELPVIAIHAAIDGAAKAYGVAHDRFEDGLNVRLRTADDAQDIRGGRLTLERLAEVSVAGLQLPEQTDVLDGNHRLAREGLEQRDLRVGEGAHLRAEHGQVAQRLPLAQQ